MGSHDHERSHVVNGSETAEGKVKDLLARMTLDEKLAQLGCMWSGSVITDGQFDEEAAAWHMRHGIGHVARMGGGTGLRPGQSAALVNAVQKVAIEHTRLGIPVLVHEEAVGGLCQRDATVFPQALGLAATWDPALVESVADVIRRQMLATGARLALAPVLDVARDPRWGRVEETYGEDPMLCGTLGAAYVRGLQTDDLRHGVAATGKHFLGYAMSEGGRNWNPVQLGLRELLEVYAEPFAAAIREAGLAGVMNSYASIDGLPCAGSRAILTDLLRDDLRFDGVVFADYDAVSHLHTYHRVASDLGEAAGRALSAGLDVELPVQECYGEPLKAEVEAGRVPMAIVDGAVRRVLRLKLRLGLFDQPYVDADATEQVFDTADQRALARRAAAESVVVLGNDGILPLKGIRRLAVIGPGADDPRVLQGDYHYPAHVELAYLASQDGEQGETRLQIPGGEFAPGPYYTPHITPLAGLRDALSDVEIGYARGCDVLGEDRSGFEEAMAAAAAADLTVVVAAGKSGLLRPVTSGEANDATNLNLPGVQSELIGAIAATGTPLVVVVLSGRVHTLEAEAARANALVLLFPPGEEGGSGLADVLTGRVNPAGRLPVSLPRSVGQIPVHAQRRAGGDRAMFFGDYIDSPVSPLFPFGHGLSYTSFAYEELEIRGSTTRQPIEISLTVRNTGDRDGDEVVQLYLRDDVASVARPSNMLLAFERIHLDAGEARRVTVVVPPSRLAFYDPEMRFVVEPGSFTISAGSSSRDIRAEGSVTLNGEFAVYRQCEVRPVEVV